MISKIQHRITSCYLSILIIFLLTNQLVFTNKIVDLIHSIGNSQNNDNLQSNDNLGIDISL